MPDMTYSDSAASIRSNAWFRSRVEVATSKYSNYLLNTPAEDVDFAAKTAYGTRIAQSSSTIVESLMFTLAGDSEVLTAGPAIPDVQLQAVVEKTVVKIFPPTASAAPPMQFGVGPMAQHWVSSPDKVQ